MLVYNPKRKRKSSQISLDKDFFEIKKLRMARGMTQNEVVKVIGYSSLSYARYEKGEREPDISTLCKLADYFNVSVDYLIGRQA